MLKKKIEITSEIGVHARPATSLVNTCMIFTCDIFLSNTRRIVDFKSIMGVMSLGIYNGTIIEIICDGIDEKEAMDAICSKIYSLNLGRVL